MDLGEPPALLVLLEGFARLSQVVAGHFGQPVAVPFTLVKPFGLEAKERLVMTEFIDQVDEVEGETGPAG